MKKIYFSVFTILLIVIFPFITFSQIYSPEGLNMPGEWNSWTNPPANNLAFASSTQVTDGRIVLIESGTQRWQTIFHVAASGGDIAEGIYNWLFTSGPEATPFDNKWADVTVSFNTIQQYNYQGSSDNNITLSNGHWYTMNWQDIGYANTYAIFMETSGDPVDILTVTLPTNVQPDTPQNIDITLSASPSPEEVFYLRYTNDGWSTSTATEITVTGTTGSATINGQTAGTTVQYYVFSSTISNLTDNYDMCTIKLNNNDGTNYEYTVTGGAQPQIDWANLQYPESGTILTGESFIVYAQVFIDGVTNPSGQAADVQAWIGYSTSDTDPSTWTDWIPASYFGDAGNNDEYSADLGLAITTEGTYYYASRFQYQTQDMVYGGFSSSGGGFWDGTSNVSGILTVSNTPPAPQIDWANLQYPGSGTIQLGDDYLVYAQAWIEDSTGQSNPVDGLQAWIGLSFNDTDPSTWTTWIEADFFGPSGNNDEFFANLAPEIVSTGTYYYASRFQYLGQDYVYGGYSTSGGGFWDGTSNVNGVLTVNDGPHIGWANLQYPDSGNIEVGQEYLVYAQAWIEDSTGLTPPVSGLQAWIGYSLNNTNPSTWSNWIEADYFGVSGNNDEFIADLGAELTSQGTYYYASRFQYLDQNYVYGGFSDAGGNFWDGVDNVSGIVMVEDTAMSYPVTFTATDATGLYSNIKFKGSMTDWEPVDMVQNGSDWTCTIYIRPGSYEWGLFEDDGSQYGIWLIIGPNLEMSVAADGTVSGDTTYTITYVDINEVQANILVYPNPVKDVININIDTQNKNTKVSLYNQTGLLMQSQIINETLSQVNISKLPAGVYIMTIEDNNFRIIKKIIKQ